MNNYPRETTEYVVVNVLVDGNPVTSGVQFSVVPFTDYGVTPRPGEWVDAVIVDGKTAWLFTPETEPGKQEIWAKVTDTPEIPVVDCGSFMVS